MQSSIVKTRIMGNRAALPAQSNLSLINGLDCLEMLVAMSLRGSRLLASALRRLPPLINQNEGRQQPRRLRATARFIIDQKRCQQT